jgi:protein phosphatase
LTTAKILTAAVTDVGRRRSGNEDSWAIWTAESAGRSHAADLLLVVCDGMGGTVAGEVASRMAVETVVRDFSESTGTDLDTMLAHAIQAANQAIWDHVETRPDLKGMGTTCTAIALKGDQITIGHVGDSRAYRARGREITQLTQDHSLVAQLVARQELTAEQARHDSRRNVVTRSVGVGPDLDVDVMTHHAPLGPGETLFICSDGLHGLVEDDLLARAAGGESLEASCHDLIRLANEAGGPDNITVVAARLEPSVTDTWTPQPAPSRHAPARAPAKKAAAAPAPAGRKSALRMLIAALVALAIALTGLTWIVFGMMRSAPEPKQPTENAGVASWR